jgi:hypothetical protein
MLVDEDHVGPRGHIGQRVADARAERLNSGSWYARILGIRLLGSVQVRIAPLTKASLVLPASAIGSSCRRASATEPACTMGTATAMTTATTASAFNTELRRPALRAVAVIATAAKIIGDRHNCPILSPTQSLM